jgi:hypothetical protein
MVPNNRLPAFNCLRQRLAIRLCAIRKIRTDLWYQIAALEPISPDGQ